MVKKKKKKEQLNIFGVLHHMMGGTIADRARRVEELEREKFKFEKKKFKHETEFAGKEFKQTRREARKSGELAREQLGLDVRKVEVSEATEKRALGSQAIQDRYMDALADLNREQAKILGDKDLNEAKQMLVANQALYSDAQYKELMQPIKARQRILDMKGPLTENQQAQQDAVISELAGIRTITKISDEIGLMNVKISQAELLIKALAEDRAQLQAANERGASLLQLMLGASGAMENVFGKDATEDMMSQQLKKVLGTDAEILPSGKSKWFNPWSWGESGGKEIGPQEEPETSIQPNTELERVLQNLQGLER